MTETPAEPDAEAPTSNDYEVPEWLSLDDGEEVQWVGEPVPVSIVGTAVWGVILTVVLVGFLILLSLPFAWLSLKNTDYVVTNEALYVKKGVLSTNIESVSLDKIQNTEYSQSFWGKQFDFGSIDVSTAGSSGAEISFRNVADARSVRETINAQSNEYAARRSRGARDEAADGTDVPSADGLDELIAELRATREAMERVERRLSDEATVATDDSPADADSPN